MGPVSYTIVIEINYTSPELHQFGEDQKSGESYTFHCEFVLIQAELDNFGSENSDTAQYAHDGGNGEIYRYMIEMTPDATILRDGQA